MSKIPNVVIISDQEKDRNSGINGVLRNIIPHLREKMDVGWKVVSGLFVYRNNFLDNHLPTLIKLIIVTSLSLIKLLFSRNVWNFALNKADYFIASSQLVRNCLDVKFVVIAPVAKKKYRSP